jgi:hypothetical protein
MLMTELNTKCSVNYIHTMYFSFNVEQSASKKNDELFAGISISSREK